MLRKKYSVYLNFLMLNTTNIKLNIYTYIFKITLFNIKGQPVEANFSLMYNFHKSRI